MSGRLPRHISVQLQSGCARRYLCTTYTHHAIMQLINKDELYKLILSHKLSTIAKSGKKQDFVNVILSALKLNSPMNAMLVKDIQDLVKLKKGSTRKAGNV